MRRSESYWNDWRLDVGMIVAVVAFRKLLTYIDQLELYRLGQDLVDPNKLTSREEHYFRFMSTRKKFIQATGEAYRLRTATGKLDNPSSMHVDHVRYIDFEKRLYSFPHFDPSGLQKKKFLVNVIDKHSCLFWLVMITFFYYQNYILLRYCCKIKFYICVWLSII